LTVDVARLPRIELPRGQLLYRVHRAVAEPWYFSGDGGGRFDPVSTGGRGACYLAEDPLGSWVEAFRTMITIAEADVSRRLLATVELDRPVVVVDLTNRQALRAGMTAAVTAGADYSESHEVADQAQGQVEGIRWRVRHDMEQTLIGVALFGPAGPQPAGNWPPTRSDRIPPVLVREAEDTFGYRVVPTP
jgi:RES domain-containing protein